MFFKVVSLVFSVLLGMIYVIGFLYDSAFLEKFGVNYYEMLGSPLDYLSIGGIFLLTSYANNLSFLVFVLGVIGVIYMPVKRHIPKEKVEKYIDVESIPYIIFSVIPILFLFPLSTISDAKQASKDIVNNANDILCIESKSECYKGVVLRYRDSKIIFYNKETEKVSVYSDKRLISAEHDNN